jgi:hypothetical protein
MNANSQNSKIGKDFEIAVKAWFENHYNQRFNNNTPFDIGNPSKPHRFDVVSDDNQIVAECKCYSWTEVGNIPSAKMGFVNEAVFYLSLIRNANTYIVMKKSVHPRRKETLAEYYYRTNKHLLGNTRLLEYDVKLNIMKEIKNSTFI